MNTNSYANIKEESYIPEIEELFSKKEWQAFRPFIYIRKSIRDFKTRIGEMKLFCELIEDDFNNYPRIIFKVTNTYNKLIELRVYVSEDNDSSKINFLLNSSIEPIILESDFFEDSSKIKEILKLIFKDLLISINKKEIKLEKVKLEVEDKKKEEIDQSSIVNELDFNLISFEKDVVEDDDVLFPAKQTIIESANENSKQKEEPENLFSGLSFDKEN